MISREVTGSGGLMACVSAFILFSRRDLQLQREGRILLGLKNYVTAKVGESVRVLNLHNSRAVTSGVVCISRPDTSPKTPSFLL